MRSIAYLIATLIMSGTAVAAPDEIGASPRERAHWAFQSPKRPPVPVIRTAPLHAATVMERLAVRNPLDAFLLAELRKRGLTFAPEADRRTLIRRATYDLIGLPPTPEEVEAFVNNISCDAYEKVIERLLNSPRYGERWGRHWLDVAGYADSEGVLEEDRIRTNAWRYRDYVIHSFNDDKPYDRFLLEQIAGDELVDYRNATKFTREVVDPLIATGFLRTAVDATRDDFPPRDFAEYQWRMFFDTQQIVSTAIMGLTIQCARCHDHKFEPIAQKDYYRLQAFFAGAIRPTGPVLPTYRREIVAATKAEQDAAKETNAKVDAAVKAIGDQLSALTKEFKAKHPKGQNATDAELRQMFADYGKRVDDLNRAKPAEESKRATLPTIRALYDLDASPPKTHLLKRGDPLNPGEEVAPGVFTVLSGGNVALQLTPCGPEAKTTGRRRALAAWLTHPDHPLTARVMVNRIWTHHFGEGIVRTLDNFGTSGAPPTNRALLDYLATEFVRRGWSVKAMHRLMMTSSAYRQGVDVVAAGFTPAGSRVSPSPTLINNDTLRPAGIKPAATMSTARRLEAEIIRDAILAVAGKLDATMFGEPVPTEAKPTGEVVPVGDAKSGRRSIYQLVRRSRPQTILNLFDAPVMEVNCVRRSTSTTASQALALMNSEFVSAHAEHFAQRVLKEAPPSGDNHTATVERAFALAFGRKPTALELARAAAFVKGQVAAHDKSKSLESMVKAYGDLCQALMGANEFVYVD